MKGARDASAFQWLFGRIFFPDRHESGHFVFGEANLVPPEPPQPEIGYFVCVIRADGAPPEPSLLDKARAIRKFTRLGTR